MFGYKNGLYFMCNKMKLNYFEIENININVYI